jgi:hypothetical protein
MDVDEPTTNGNAKRKARISTGKAVKYNVDGSESSDDAVPLVCGPTVFNLLPGLDPKLLLPVVFTAY